MPVTFTHQPLESMSRGTRVKSREPSETQKARLLHAMTPVFRDCSRGNLFRQREAGLLKLADASARAKAHLAELGIVSEQEMPYVRRVLSAAALTYVAATLQVVLTLLYYIMRFSGNRR